MADCELIAACLFFNDKMKDYEGLSAIIKKNYCLGDNSKCARYIVFKKLGRPAVPPDLYPSMVDRAEQMCGVQ